MASFVKITDQGPYNQTASIEQNTGTQSRNETVDYNYGGRTCKSIHVSQSAPWTIHVINWGGTSVMSCQLYLESYNTPTALFSGPYPFGGGFSHGGSRQSIYPKPNFIAGSTMIRVGVSGGVHESTINSSTLRSNQVQISSSSQRPSSFDNSAYASYYVLTNLYIHLLIND